MVPAMRLRVALPLIAALALLAALMLSTSAPAGDKAGSGNQGACKKHPKKKGCKKGDGPKTGVGDVPDCDSGAPQECHVDITVRQGAPTTGATCDSFDNGEGLCLGSSTGTTRWTEPGYSPKIGIGVSFTWKAHGAPRDVDYTANDSVTIVQAYIRGDVPSSGSATFNVTDAWNRQADVHWKTVSTGGAPGTRGGPLYIDYEHKFVGSYVHIFGYLVRK